MNDEADPMMPFGKHKGEHASDIPVEYLDWLIGQDWFVDRFTRLAEQVTEHLYTRSEWERLGDA